MGWKNNFGEKQHFQKEKNYGVLNSQALFFPPGKHFLIAGSSELIAYLISGVYNPGKRILLRGNECFLFLIPPFPNPIT